MVTNAFPPSAMARRISRSSPAWLRQRSTKTSGCTLAMTNESMRQPLASCVPASTAACTAEVSPPIMTMYLPEQIERDKMSRTLPAFNIVSATTKPEATLDSSISPMDFSFISSERNSLLFLAAENAGRRSLAISLSPQRGEGLRERGGNLQESSLQSGIQPRSHPALHP